MKQFFKLFTLVLMVGLFVSTTAWGQVEDDVVINEFVVNPATGKEYVEILVVAASVDIRNWTLSDVGTRGGSTSTTEGDFTLPNASYLQAVPRGTYIVIEFTTPSGNTSTLTEDLSLTDGTPRTLILKTSTSGVTLAGTIDNATADNLHLYAGTRATGTLIDQVLCGNNTSYIAGATWGDNNGATLGDNVNGGSALPSNCAVRFVPTETTITAFGDNDTGIRFVVDGTSYGTPGTVNTGVNDDGGSLPIQLASFVGYFVNTSDLTFEWETISEKNNYGFWIQTRSTGSEEYVTIEESFQAGAGSTLQPQQYRWTYKNAVTDNTEFYLLQQDDDGLQNRFGPIMLNPNNVPVETAPLVFALNQNYPNPFNPSTVINYQLATDNYTTLKVYNLIGKEVATLVNGYQTAGSHRVTFDASQLSNGIYLYKLQSGNNVEVKKLTLVK